MWRKTAKHVGIFFLCLYKNTVIKGDIQRKSVIGENNIQQIMYNTQRKFIFMKRDKNIAQGRDKFKRRKQKDFGLVLLTVSFNK